MTQPSLFSNDPKPEAVFSETGSHRYLLRWPSGAPGFRVLVCCAANPSKAGQPDGRGGMRSDPTVSRMRNLARELGYAWLWMVNARAYVATDPRDVPGDPEAVGSLNDHWLSYAFEHADLVVLAYGHLAGTRAPRVLELVRSAGKVPHALALAKDGTPRHPRGIPASARPFPMEVADG